MDRKKFAPESRPPFLDAIRDRPDPGAQDLIDTPFPAHDSETPAFIISLATLQMSIAVVQEDI